MARPVVAIVGRPNVGKSTLFNRLIGERRAVMHDVPGTTRDRLYGVAEWRGREFTVIDTGGIEPEPGLARAVPDNGGPGRWGTLPTVEILGQAREAMDEADVILFVVDAASGPVAADVDVADLLRRSRKPVLLGANKADGLRQGRNAVEFFELGLGEAIPISSLHGTGTGDLLDEIVDRLPPSEEAAEDEADLSIAIVGRPNVGKSSLLNALLGRQRAIVSPVPGTTRDPIDTELRFEGLRVLLIDTAGIRRRGKIDRGVEKFSVLRAVRAIERAEVAVLVIDAAEGLTAQDTHVAGYVRDARKGLIVAVNKWDLIEKDQHTTDEFTVRIRRELEFVDWAPLLFISAQTGQRVRRVLEFARDVQAARDTRIPTPKVIELVRAAVARHPHNERGRQLKIFYATQAAVRPPTFVFFVNDPKLLHFSYERYLENQLRAAFGFEGTALRLVFRARNES
ncbi:MAG: ribosome biogenesis GTPase Der [Chloroflexi bacterium]|nr:ribosome biogenesis GTPase Der [Chloroflexota bacterium]